ncbi:MAG: hypothetical protein A3B74_03295 [Candidatus Kerfeldbacteria bacterium RIFCSPHIGHO2_02_FULL_42_14]|uniref:DUF721 domain-containing protein n=1 Tax=Candidatus Kerfeldbacteria bacterium RIFCSPHIGHO2_02_FULL_42_14 TaxID=1798540 RepID=A0A1G2AQF9_9BACT|nr:MAG: hypothetical protein A3B74_03295 [Candidatus Kerfeldbacteria bacterium RIFCSPHIGHO2_02_FULL_42_14]OGY80933.1 MAG: hypothetical protein A3E60_03205 [Candidatus Kerfeldbacteria bacterium RIFCSPHIGHO2_12_FULL_42_13]OGY84167.1 MAG: hypothetical protein A3I91_01610 [Candidatus Kerfeldbacteria bacterium RIFCSPLOWO2_02_FULL_42_19]OGY87298.1 MAG: hypothetical protein A3G01_03085 [Candidatus Kerfeldbacteria bacterium RIFCSPLOWO2_12_FULL_43_9]
MFVPLSQLLSITLRKKNIEKEVSAARIIDSASAILKEQFGEAIFEYVRLKYVKGTRLFLSVSSSVVAQEVRLKQEAMLQELNRKIFPLRIDRFCFVS